MTKRLGYGARRDGASWMWITWPDNIVHGSDVLYWLSELKLVSGCKVFPGGANIPKTAEHTEAFQKLLQACGLEEPKWQAPKKFFDTEPVESINERGTTLFPHQIEAVAKFSENGGRGLLADEPGLGKTRTAIEFSRIAAERYDNKRPTVILAKKYLRATWLRELRLCGVPEEEICSIETRNVDNDSFKENASWYFVNPEIVRAWWPRILMRRPATALVDEAHHYKQSTSNRSKGAQMLATSPHVLYMTGTPMPDRPQDMWSLMNMITGNHSWGSSRDFIQRYCGAVYNGHGYVPDFPTNVEEFKARIEPWYLRRTLTSLKDSGFTLPEMSRTVIESSWEDVRLGAQVSKKHHHVLKTNYAQISRAMIEGKFTDDVFSTIGLLRMQTSLAKVDTTVEYVQELHDAGESVVVFTWSREAAKEIGKRLSVRGPAPDTFVCTGDDSQTKRDAMVAQFQANGGILIATYGTLAEGVTLTRARFAVLHDLEWTPAVIEQAEKRIHRISQTNACIVAWNIMRDSIDELFAKRLQWKLNANAELLDNVNPGLLSMVVGITKPTSFEDDFEAYMAKWRAA